MRLERPMDIPSTSGMYVLEKDEKYPRIDQFHCTARCIKRGLNKEQYTEFLAKKWKSEIVKDAVWQLKEEEKVGAKFVSLQMKMEKKRGK